MTTLLLQRRAAAPGRSSDGGCADGFGTTPMLRSLAGSGVVEAGILRLQAQAGNAAVTAGLGDAVAVQRCGGNGCDCDTDAEDINVQRGWLGDLLDDTAEVVTGAASGIAKGAKEVISTGVKAVTTGLGILSLPECREAVAKPSLGSWLDDPGLESIRHDPAKALSQSNASGPALASTRLVKQFLASWGCEELLRDVLPRHGVNSTFGTETAKAVKSFQLVSFMSPDGQIGPKTLAAMDQRMGVVRRDKAEIADAGGDASQGDSKFTPHTGAEQFVAGRTVAQVFFPTDRHDLDDDDDGVLRNLAREAQETSDMRLRVVAYADKRESSAHNEALTLGRAGAVSETLREHCDFWGVSPTITYESRGEVERPQPGSTAAELKPFRRAEVVVESVTYPEVAPVGDCPARVANEDQDSHDGFSLKLEVAEDNGSERLEFWRVEGFPIDAWTLEEMDEADYSKLGEVLDPKRLTQAKVRGHLQCWKLDAAWAKGSADCHEMHKDPVLGIARAEAVRDEFSGADVRAHPGIGVHPNDTADGRKKNRSVRLLVKRDLAQSVDFTGEPLDDLLGKFKKEKETLSSRYGEYLIDLADQLATQGDGADDRILNWPGAIGVTTSTWASPGCFDSEAYTWTSARADVGARLLALLETQGEAAYSCGTSTNVDQLMTAVKDAVYEPMMAGLALLLQPPLNPKYSGGGGITGAFSGCGCVGLKILWQRAQDPTDIYHPLKNHQLWEDFREQKRYAKPCPPG